MNEARRTYFENRILTAKPERLHLMLLESALQAGRKADELLASKAATAAGAELAHAEAIVADILGRMRKEIAPAIVENSTAVYAFILDRLMRAHVTGDVQALRDALRVLEVEQETWRQVCERATNAAPAPHAPFNSHSAAETGGLTLEA